MPNPAVLFDIDGTLVDSNYLHVHAWHRAFAALDVDVASWRVHRRIGMDGSTLLTELLGDSDSETAERAKELHDRFYTDAADLIRPLPAGRDVLDAVGRMGLQVVLATSAPEHELDILRRVLDRDDLVSTMTSSNDVETAKPRPDIVRVALERAGVGPDDAVFVGDAVWDVRAAARAGVPCIALLSGGISRGELEGEGAVAVYEDVSEMLEQLDDGPVGRLAARVG